MAGSPASQELYNYVMSLSMLLYGYVFVTMIPCQSRGPGPVCRSHQYYRHYYHSSDVQLSKVQFVFVFQNAIEISLSVENL